LYAKKHPLTYYKPPTTIFTGGISMSAENKALIRRVYEEAWNKGNLAILDEVVSPDYVDHSLPPGLPPGKEGIKQLIAMYQAAFPDTVMTVEDQIAEGDKVVTRWSARGTHKGELMGVPPTGKVVTVSGIDISRVADGMEVEHWAEFDLMGMMQQLGVVPAPGESEG
jgi:steroid delta-isomerase-like uncharacterized protein